MLDDPVIGRLRKCLRAVPLDEEIIHEADATFFDEQVNELADKIYATDRRGRSRKQIVEHISIGKLGEFIFASLLRQGGLPVTLNKEKVTGEYHWDLLVESLKIEVKFQNVNSVFLNFSHEEKAKFAAEKWREWDLMLAWKTNTDRTTFFPWLIIDHEAFNPEQKKRDGTPLYGKSDFQGTYLAVGVAQGRNLLINLMP